VEGVRAVQQTVEEPDSPLGPRAYLPEQITRVLREDETVVYWGRPSWVVLAMREAWLVLGVLLPTSAAATLLSYVGFRLFVPLLFLVAFLITIAVGALLFWSWRNTVYVLTSHRLLSRASIPSLDVVTTPLAKVKSISLHPGFIQRLFGLGSLYIST
jgi:uncharacterized membrane protein YdbT with pleckstrin-like domain